MWNAFLTRVGFFMLGKGADFILRRYFGKELQRGLIQVIADLEVNGDLTSKQKYNRAKKFLDEADVSIPDSMKNLLIEIVVTKITKVK